MDNSRRNMILRRTDQLRQATPVLTALVVGGLVGAGAMMLLAPQSGKETRSKIQNTTVDLRDRAVGGVKSAMKQVTSRAGDLTSDVKDRADNLQHQGRESLADQLEHVEHAVKKARKTLKA